MHDSALAAQIESMKSSAERNSLHLKLVMGLITVATESNDLPNFVSRSLELIAKTNNWVLGQYWTINQQQKIANCSEWFHSSVILNEFRQASLERKISQGVGIVGKTWGVSYPVSMPNVQAETGMNFPRKESATRCGIKGAFAIPLKQGPFVTGVYEFFSFETIKIDDKDELFYEKLGIFIANFIAQKEINLTIRQNEALNKLVVENAHNAFVSITELSVITTWTPKAEQLFGWSGDEVIGKSLAEIIIPERYRDAHGKGILRYLATGESRVSHKKVMAPALHRSGREIMVELSIFPIESINARRFGAFIVNCELPPAPPDIVLT